MNSKQVHTTPSGKPMHLPDPDPSNITVLTRNLPNNPILPWSHYDSPWLEAEDQQEQQLQDDSEGSGELSNEQVDAQEEQLEAETEGESFDRQGNRPLTDDIT